jgi:hypothetical protein
MTLPCQRLWVALVSLAAPPGGRSPECQQREPRAENPCSGGFQKRRTGGFEGTIRRVTDNGLFASEFASSARLVA